MLERFEGRWLAERRRDADRWACSARRNIAPVEAASSEDYCRNGKAEALPVKKVSDGGRRAPVLPIFLEKIFRLHPEWRMKRSKIF